MTRPRRLARALALLALLVGWLLLAAARGRYFDPPRVGREEVDPRAIVVLDGDTVVHGGRLLRFLAVDTPECAAPWFDGDQEPWAGRARSFVEDALRGAHRATILRGGHPDVHGRDLVHVLVDDVPLAVLLVEAGLACETVSLYGDGGFPEIAALVVARARPVAFERPWTWRRLHRRPPE
ncbi:MAG: thermonuclease family protein [Planctomycetes bacterium]|nr:thermonuclease family protein [Planctomycetota bacterium]